MCVCVCMCVRRGGDERGRSAGLGGWGGGGGGALIDRKKRPCLFAACIGGGGGGCLCVCVCVCVYACGGKDLLILIFHGSPMAVILKRGGGGVST